MRVTYRARERRGIHTNIHKHTNILFCGMFEENGSLEMPTRRFDDNIEINSKENTRLRTGFIWLKIGVNGGLL
jgi:hypothetical protein